MMKILFLNKPINSNVIFWKHQYDPSTWEDNRKIHFWKRWIIMKGESEGFTTRYYEINRSRVQIQTQVSMAIQYSIQMILHWDDKRRELLNRVYRDKYIAIEGSILSPHTLTKNKPLRKVENSASHFNNFKTDFLSMTWMPNNIK